MKKEFVFMFVILLMVGIVFSAKVMTGFLVMKTKHVQVRCSDDTCAKEQSKVVRVHASSVKQSPRRVYAQERPVIVASQTRSPSRVYGKAEKKQMIVVGTAPTAEANTEQSVTPVTRQSPTFQVDAKKMEAKKKQQCQSNCLEYLGVCGVSCDRVGPFEKPLCVVECVHKQRKCQERC